MDPNFMFVYAISVVDFVSRRLIAQKDPLHIHSLSDKGVNALLLKCADALITESSSPVAVTATTCARPYNQTQFPHSKIFSKHISSSSYF